MSEQATNVPAPGEPATPREDGAALVRDWEKFLGRTVEGAESFARQKPLAALLFAFLAGFVINAVISALFRRR